MNNNNNMRKLYHQYKANMLRAERDELSGGILMIKENDKDCRLDVVIDEYGNRHVVHERGADYIIFVHKSGRRYISTKLSGNVPKSFFKDKDDNEAGS